jgi:hypothetical protein
LLTKQFLDASLSHSIPDASPLDLSWIPNDAFGGLKPSSTTLSTKNADPDSDTESLLDDVHEHNNTSDVLKIDEAQIDADMDVAEDVDEWL